MGIFVAFIVYFACGSPFAVYRVAVADVVSPRVVGKSAVYLLLWPLSAVRFVIWHLPRVTFRRRGSIAEIRNALEEAAFGHTTIERRIRFRDVFDRYVAFQAAAPAAGSYEFLKLSGHSDISLAAACMERRSLNRLERGRVESREDLLKVTNATVVNDPRTSALLSALSEILDDQLLRDGLGNDALSAQDSFGPITPITAGR